VCINPGAQVEVKKAVPKAESRPVRYSSKKTKKVFIGGISPETTKEDILTAFADYDIQEAQVMTEKGTEKPRGFGFAVFKDCEIVEEICKKKYFQIRVF
jgi:RNA recognition motif-containing protein